VISDRHSLVDVAEDDADQIVATLAQQAIKGRKLIVRRDSPRRG
jgi:hypothetical protein